MMILSKFRCLVLNLLLSYPILSWSLPLLEYNNFMVGLAPFMILFRKTPDFLQRANLVLNLVAFFVIVNVLRLYTFQKIIEKKTRQVYHVLLY